ncbi:MAG: hypothetical protein KIS66_11865 [Fimbriimonadaceae bacterium]|nr:hypothetical protein [Fimbriimonadaceae bacterium]
MSTKNVKSVKNSLKFKAVPREGALTVRVGVKKFVLPLEARILSGDGYLFLSFSALSELFRVSERGLTAMAQDADATEAYEKLNPGRRRSRRKGAAPAELPEDLAKALSAIPEGFRLGFDANGAPRLVKTRNRRKKNA